ncbi:MAG: terminase large subunit [Actinobacteria bacterium]|nr:terminase large subunit [Actinomycetota bacterium]
MIAPWPPQRFTPPLSAGFTAAIDPWLPLLRIVWQRAFGYVLEDWQETLLRHMTEVFPDGHRRAGQLRFRQVVVSLGRQNGKTEIAAALGLWAMLMWSMAYVVGIASSREQATLVYKRTLMAITANRALAKRFERMTDTRGITSKSGSTYELKAAKGAALQGIPVRLAVCDELHLIKPELWSALVAGTGGRPDTLVAGITTAGDEDSELLLDLYDRGAKAIADPETRMGFFVWEAPEARVPDDDDELMDYLAMANPSVASGRLDAEAVLSDVRALPLADQLRYRLNVFTKRSSAFIPAELWLKSARRPDEAFPSGRPVFAIDRTPDWGYATITATVKDEHGVVWSEIVASIVKPTLEQLVDVCVRLSKHNPVVYAADNYSLRPLLDELRRHGFQVFAATLGDVTGASALFYSLLTSGRLRHADDPLLAHQVPRTVRKNVGEAFRVSRKDSSVAIDGVISTMLGAYVVETVREPSVQVF